MIILSWEYFSPIHEYLYKFNRFKKLEATADAYIQCLAAQKYTQRDYLFIIQPKHRAPIIQTIQKILNSDWYKNGYLFQRNLIEGSLIGKPK